MDGHLYCNNDQIHGQHDAPRELVWTLEREAGTYFYSMGDFSLRRGSLEMSYARKGLRKAWGKMRTMQRKLEEATIDPPPIKASKKSSLS